MKRKGFDDRDVMILKNNRKHTYFELYPFNGNCMVMKISKCGRIVFLDGKYHKYLFKMKKGNILNKNITEMKYTFFTDYVNTMFQKSKDEHFAYQFCFQILQNKDVYSCSFYPCIIDSEAKSVDIVIRKTLLPPAWDESYWTML